MTIKGTLSRVATIGGRVQGQGNIRAKQVAIGSGGGGTDLTSKSINELSDVNASETDDGLYHMMQQQINGLLQQL